ncbi:MAG: HisA/HisF-related TIM barrel protein [Thermogemmata sp.]|jgi:phosphoribosylformimino-5-aminoimidazole carboxamide ribotide isomerase|uniref:Peptidase A2 domain-containing protein n=1 Tax=Thermogemmata fonticola TaxID=2755323 RepID=A0A7V9AAP4_9BACT|nr:HisA/HisF-related TIM barrel protein [Thermogemmata fonticola]MBA2225233.1 hypothetical protein [Thermogemmata fonticola]MCX8139680.1 HisA/HisF-related TIM barrel protein [Gemmataceae bacterium]
MIAPGRLIPVMDIRRGEVVHARAGDRQSYRTLRSPLIGQTLRHTALQLLQTAGSTRLYVADLDALLGEAPSEAVTQLLHELPECEILLDRGRQLSRELPPNVRPVLPLEAGWSAEEHAMLLPRWQARRPLFSLDLRQGRLADGYQRWDVSGPEAVLALVDRVRAVGYPGLVVIDVARVGTESGVEGICALVRSIRQRWPEVEIVAGGGVRNPRDGQGLIAAGADAILVATALHRGRWNGSDTAITGFG